MRLPLVFNPRKEYDMADYGLLLLRVGVGLTMMLAHGWRKLSNFGTLSEKFADPFGLGMTLSLGFTVFAEVFCSIAIIVGLLTRLATVPLIIVMLVAIFIIHADDPWQKQEFALMYLIPYLTLLIAGAGRFSLDAKLSSSRPGA